ncbi:hypothetical protein NDU88_007967 [Pleurodeles waltl]|uniref:Uncharacterized protein n=1 Tax=Pleurodeles waltl TaxID=8319 RepID=A0AAV7VTT9_PLEWA|nr:hypothetical protein NDU88_007967 [Pleurodeles waltl]
MIKRVNRKRKKEETMANSEMEKKTQDPRQQNEGMHNQERAGPEPVESGMCSREDAGSETKKEGKHNKAKHEDE